MNTRKYSKAQEKRVAKDIGGRVNANSGATDFYKGDVRTKDFLVECKTSTKPVKSFSIKKDWLVKLKEEAFSMGKSKIAIGFDFGDGEDYFIIDKRSFQEYIEMIEGEGNE